MTLERESAPLCSLGSLPAFYAESFSRSYSRDAPSYGLSTGDITVIHPMQESEANTNEKEVRQPDCSHFKVELESTKTGYFTGKYVCSTCGQIVYEHEVPPKD